MTHSILMSLNEAEFKAFLREALKEVLGETKGNAEQNCASILNIKEASSYLKLKVSTLYEKTGAKVLPHFKRGNRLYFYRAELEAWLREGRVKTQKELQGEATTYTMQKHKHAP